MLNNILPSRSILPKYTGGKGSRSDPFYLWILFYEFLKLLKKFIFLSPPRTELFTLLYFVNSKYVFIHIQNDY